MSTPKKTADSEPRQETAAKAEPKAAPKAAAKKAKKVEATAALANPFADMFKADMFKADMFGEYGDAFQKAFANVPNIQDAVEFSQGNVEAVMKSGEIFSKGVQDLNAMWMDTAKVALEEQAATAKSAMECRSLPDMVELQSDLAKVNYDKALEGGRKFSDASLKVLEEATEPLAERVSLAVEKYAKPIAA